MWMYTKVFCLLFLHHLGSAIFTTNPTNVTTCLGSPAVFTCVISDTVTISWLINGSSPSSSSPSTPLTSGPGQQSTLIVPGTSQLNGASVQCYYLPPGSLTVLLSPPAYLSVQAPPAAPTNLTDTPINATSTILAWGPAPVQSPSLSYVVEVSNGSGVLVYRGTVTVPQVTITTPDPCDQYKATVSAQYIMPNLTCTGNSSSSKSLGAPPSVIQPTTSLMFPMSPQDNVTLNIPLPYQSGVCYYKTVAISGSEVYSFPSMKPLPQYGGQVNITISLPPNKHFTLIITASNGYGNTTSSVAISTFGVIGISANTSSPTGLVCLFNPGSLAIGCLVYLTDTATGTRYCRVVGRSLDTPVTTMSCSSNGLLGTGVYSVVVCVIESDGSVSSIPAITGEVLNISSSLIGPSAMSPEPSRSPNTASAGFMIGGVIGIVGGLIITIIIITIIIITIIILGVRHQRKQEGDGCDVQSVGHGEKSFPHRNLQEWTVAEDEGQQKQSDTKAQYIDITFGKLPYLAPGEEKHVVYSTVAQVKNLQTNSLSGDERLHRDQELGTKTIEQLIKEEELQAELLRMKEELQAKDQELQRASKKLTKAMEQLRDKDQEFIAVTEQVAPLSIHIEAIIAAAKMQKTQPASTKPIDRMAD